MTTTRKNKTASGRGKAPGRVSRTANPKEKKPTFRIPYGQPIRCREDRDGVTSAYVMTEEDLKEYAAASSKMPQAPAATRDDREREEESAEEKRKRMCRELFGEEEEDDDCGVPDQTAPQSPPPPTTPPDDDQRPGDGSMQTFLDPVSTLMDSTNMEAILPPSVATRMCPYPFRLGDFVSAWDPSDRGPPSPGAEPINCWYDCHPVEGRPFRLPWFRDPKTGTYHVMGYFCGVGCARAFNAREFGRSSSGVSRRDALAVELATTFYGYSLCRMPVAPDRLLLREYGGPLTIEEFRSYANGDEPSSRRISLEYPYVVVPQIVREYSDERDADYRRVFMQAAERPIPGTREPTKCATAIAEASAKAVAEAASGGVGGAGWSKKRPRLGELDKYRISMWRQKCKREALAAPMRKRRPDEGCEGGAPGRPKRQRTNPSPPPPPPQQQQQQQSPPPQYRSQPQLQPPPTPHQTPAPPPNTPDTTLQQQQQQQRPQQSPIARPPERDGYRSLRDLLHR